MAYYDPSTWIDATDSLVSCVEHRMMMNKRAKTPKRRAGGRSFQPRGSIELDVEIQATGEVLRLTQWMDQLDKIFVNLQSDNKVFRKGHFNQCWHHNPNDKNVPPPHHVHFPTILYPDLTRRPTYAHPIRARDDYLDMLQRFCDSVNIAIKNVSLPLWRR